ncbi:hypothetical protein M0802_012274 [Mischocyttarus mexicanus]|nr:hypothetical protein M0802_012274 [Mischocyttarus mexicanus]
MYNSRAKVYITIVARLFSFNSVYVFMWQALRISTKNNDPFLNCSIKQSKYMSRNLSNKQLEVQLPEFADVIIIGGGSAGCHALYHLAKRGINAILLEKSKLTSGTTWHTAGLVWNLRGVDDVEMELLNTSINVLSSLEEESGINPGWINNGGLYIAHSDERMAEYKRLVTTGKAFGIDANIISPNEAKTIFPLLDEQIFQGAVYCKKDGTVDPAMLINSLLKIAKNYGSKIIEDCPVTKILTKENVYGLKKVVAVETPHGKINTNIILNASGAWSNDIAKLAGLNIPLIPIKHAYVVTEAIEAVKNLPNVPTDFAFSLYELDWNVFNVHMESMVKLMPILSSTGIKTTVCGPESFTPDHKPIMGEDPRCSGFYHSCGYNSAGMMFGGGCGEQIALWIINGRPDKHMFKYDIRSFAQVFHALFIIYAGTIRGGPPTTTNQQQQQTNRELNAQYGPGPSLRPQTEGSWIQGGSRTTSGTTPPAGAPGNGNTPAVQGPPIISGSAGHTEALPGGRQNLGQSPNMAMAQAGQSSTSPNSQQGPLPSGSHQPSILLYMPINTLTVCKGHTDLATAL